MHYVVRRLGFRITRGWFALILIAGTLLGAAFWIGPFSPQPAELKLVALSGDGRFHDYIGIPAAWADSLPAASEATARFPLILAVHNAGAAAARPTTLALSLPARFRLTAGRGRPLPFHATPGNPLVRYDLPIRAATIEPAQMPTIISGADTLWLEPVVPNMYCTTLNDSIPEFVSAPQQNPDLMSRVKIFYSFGGARIRTRQAGLLTIQVDPNLVRRDPAPNPPIFGTDVIKPEAPRPVMSGLTFVGARTTQCGDPSRPVEIEDALWQTASGGRYFVLHQRGKARKYLFDLDRDSIIELEMWDGDGDGKFESRRVAHMAIPSFLMPFPKEDTTAVVLAGAPGVKIDTVPATPEWMQTFYDTAAGPLRFAGVKDSAGASASASDSTRVPPPAPTASAPVNPVPVAPPAPAKVDSAWLRTFNNTSAGPFRFYRGPLPLPAAPKPAPPKPRRNNGPRLLGVPIDSIRR